MRRKFRCLNFNKITFTKLKLTFIFGTFFSTFLLFFLLLLSYLTFSFNANAGKLTDKVLADLTEKQQKDWPKVYRGSDLKKVIKNISNRKNIKRFNYHFAWVYFNGKKFEIKNIDEHHRKITLRDYINSKVAHKLGKKPFTFFVDLSDYNPIEKLNPQEYPIISFSYKIKDHQKAILAPDVYLLK